MFARRAFVEREEILLSIICFFPVKVDLDIVLTRRVFFVFRPAHSRKDLRVPATKPSHEDRLEDVQGPGRCIAHDS